MVPTRHGPRITVGQAVTAWACQRHASILLDPEQARPRSSEGAFRLSNAISGAVFDAHRLYEDTSRPRNGLSDALAAAVAPPDLGHEEAARFRTALDAYEEAWGSDAEADSVQLHARADTSLNTAVGHAGVTLGGMVKLAFSLVPGEPGRMTGAIEVRLLTVGPMPSGVVDTRADALRLIALGAAEGVVKRLTVSPNGETSLQEHSFTHAELRQVFRSFGDMVDAAVAAGPSAAVTSGWWCSGCSFVRNCPAVSSTKMADLLETYPR
jgi:hypothetical protein